MLSFLFVEEEKEFVPRSTSSEAFLVGVVVVELEVESARAKVLPCCEGLREGAAGRRRGTRQKRFGFPFDRSGGAVSSPESTSIQILKN